MVGFEQMETSRPAFYGKATPSPITGKMTIQFSSFERAKKAARSFFFIFGCAVATFSVLALVFFIRTLVVHFSSNGGVIASSILFAIEILIMAALFDDFAIRLNDLENYRTETEYDDALVVKSFAFNFINAYACLFYIAFFKPYFTKLDPCVGSCMDELSMTLAIILFTRLALGNFFEIFGPLWEAWRSKNSIMKTYRSVIPADKKKKNFFWNSKTDEARESLVRENGFEASTDGHLTEVEHTFLQPSYNRFSVFNDYSELVIQFGYATMFVSAFPLSTLMCFVCNYVEMRIDSWKLCQIFRRPEPRSAEDIGTW